MDKRPQGRPPAEMTLEMGDVLCQEISTCTESLSRIVARLQTEDARFPAIATIYRKFREDNEFELRYLRAKGDQADLLADQLIEIADDSAGDDLGSTNVQRAKLRCDVRKWAASKLKPQRYGDRLDISAKVDHQHSVKSLFDTISPQTSLLGCVQVQQIEHEEAEI